MMQENLSLELYEIFSAHLQKKAMEKDIPLPPSLQFNKVYHISISEFYPPMQFVISQAAEPYLDYYIPYGEYGPNARGSYHGRITATGERIQLENYEGQFGHSFYPDDPDRNVRERENIRINNQQVHAILKAKGFTP